jgi:predicted dithiol-disulfide oxidoreductase (DUF899 family)
MPDHAVVTREEWLAARKQLQEREDELSERNRELVQRRHELPWVLVETEYRFETDEGTKTLAELFDGRSQLLVYHIMFGPDYTAACPGCSGLADHFDAGLVHLNHRDVTFSAISRAPLEKLQAYKRRMDWSFPWASSYGSDYQYDFGFALTEEQQQSIPEVRKMLEEPPDWLEEWAEHQLLDQTPNGRGDDMRVKRHDEYEDALAKGGAR